MALAYSHAKNSTSPHPLLARTHQTGAGNLRVAFDGMLARDASDEIADHAYGTLTVGKEGEARYIGSFAGSEYLQDGGDDDDVDSPVELGTLANPSRSVTHPCDPHQSMSNTLHNEPGLVELNSLILYGKGSEVDLGILRDQLPNWDDEGRSMVESYWENVNWM